MPDRNSVWARIVRAVHPAETAAKTREILKARDRIQDVGERYELMDLHVAALSDAALRKPNGSGHDDS